MFCKECGTQLNEGAAFCTNCGAQFNFQEDNAEKQAQQPHYVVYDQFDHTHEFEAKDISENKVISMLVYLMGAVGIIIALLASNTSPYAAFHVRQALKFTVVEILALVITVLLSWTIIVPLIYLILMVALVVVRFICFFQICSGKAKEPAIIRGLDFLR